jgi:hypothetical protein
MVETEKDRNGLVDICAITIQHLVRIDVCFGQTVAQQISGLRNYRSLDNTHNSELTESLLLLVDCPPVFAFKASIASLVPSTRPIHSPLRYQTGLEPRNYACPSVAQSGHRSDNKNHRSPVDSTNLACPLTHPATTLSPLTLKTKPASKTPFGCSPHPLPPVDPALPVQLPTL